MQQLVEEQFIAVKLSKLQNRHLFIFCSTQQLDSFLLTSEATNNALIAVWNFYIIWQNSSLRLQKILVSIMSLANFIEFLLLVNGCIQKSTKNKEKVAQNGLSKVKRLNFQKRWCVWIISLFYSLFLSDRQTLSPIAFVCAFLLLCPKQIWTLLKKFLSQNFL